MNTSTKSTFDVTNMLKKITVKDMPMNNYELLKIQTCSFHVFWNRWRTQSQVASCSYWVVPWYPLDFQAIVVSSYWPVKLDNHLCDVVVRSFPLVKSHGVSNYRQIAWLFNSLFKLTTNETMLHMTRPIPGDQFPSQRVINAESVPTSSCYFHQVDDKIIIRGVMNFTTPQVSMFKTTRWNYGCCFLSLNNIMMYNRAFTRQFAA